MTTNITVTSPGAAQWKVTTIVSLLSQVTFTLPTTLTSTGGQSITVTYCTTCAAYSTTNNPVGATAANPNASFNVSLALFNPVYLWLGASISPPLNQPAGTYTGSVVVTVTSLGL